MRKRRGMMVPGIILILLGFFFLLQQFTAGLLGWDRIWPVFPTLAGLAALAGWLFSDPRDPGLLFVGTGSTLVGLFFFPFTFGVFEWGDMERLWPAFPIIGGLAFLALFAGSRFRDWGAAGVGCVAVLVGVVAFGFTLFSLPRDLGSTLLKLWPLALVLIGVIGLLTGLRQRRD